MKIILEGSPISTSTIYHYHCKFGHPVGYMTAKGKALKEDYQWQIKSQFHGKPLKELLKVNIDIYFGTKRKADWDNFHKLSMDALSGLVWEDDSQVKEAHVFVKYDKERPRLEIEIKDYEAKLK